ncbi:MAG TPA: hypothetical protein VLA05_01520 [Coriobacteriia bacterium]|nr:hypothetical protein [Coriobacteriia bacterium]
MANENGQSNANRRAALGTAFFWIAGLGILFFLLPLVKAQVSLSDDLDLAAGLVPAWTFLQVCILAGILAATRTRSEDWTPRARTAFGISVGAAVALLQPWFVSLVLGRLETPLTADPVQFGVAWTMPVVFYVLPAVTIVGAWLRRERPIPTVSALGLSLFIIALSSLPYVYWLTHLWRIYIEPQSPLGDTTVMLNSGAAYLAALWRV